MIACSDATLTHTAEILAPGIAALAVAYAEILRRKVASVAAAVETRNKLSLGELADAAETRRIEEKPAEEVTVAEAAHVDAVPPSISPLDIRDKPIGSTP